MTVIERQNPKGGPELKRFPIREEEKTGALMYLLGYHDKCGEEIGFRTIDARFFAEVIGHQTQTLNEAIAGVIKEFEPKPTFKEWIHEKTRKSVEHKEKALHSPTEEWYRG